MTIVRMSLALAAFLMTARAYAFPHYRRLAIATYDTAIGCELCHARADSTERNAYGKAWHQQGETQVGFAALANLDTDGDGASNLDEIRATSNPSDARSTPADPGKYAKRARETPIPREELALVAGSAERFDVIEPAFDETQLKRLKGGLAREPSVSERVPTIYLAVRGGKPEQAIIFGQSASAAKIVSILVSAGVDGKVRKVAIYRAGGEANALQPFAKCFVGLTKDDVKSGEPIKCPGAKTTPTAALLSTAVHDALWTIWTAFSN